MYWSRTPGNWWPGQLAKWLDSRVSEAAQIVGQVGDLAWEKIAKQSLSVFIDLQLHIEIFENTMKDLYACNKWQIRTWKIPSRSSYLKKSFHSFRGTDSKSTAKVLWVLLGANWLCFKRWCNTSRTCLKRREKHTKTDGCIVSGEVSRLNRD